MTKHSSHICFASFCIHDVFVPRLYCVRFTSILRSLHVDDVLVLRFAWFTTTLCPFRSFQFHALFVSNRALSVSNRALFVSKRALFVSKRALYGLQRALFASKRALYGLQRALFVSKRTLYGLQRALYGLQRALFVLQ